MSTNDYPAENHEHIAVDVFIGVDTVTVVNGTPTVEREWVVIDPETTEVALAVVPYGNEVPVLFEDRADLVGTVGVWSGPRPVGDWSIWARITDTPEVVYQRCGFFRTY